LLRIDALARGHLRHEPVAVARNALERDAEHAVHVAVRLSGLEETDAAVIGVAHLPRELSLTEFALHAPAVGPCAERQPRHLDARLAERHPIGCFARRPQRQSPGSGERCGGESGFEESRREQ
jgi:hypothetical protein